MKIGSLSNIRNYLLVKNSDLFDREYYLENSPDALQAYADPVWHFLEVGWKEGRNPSAEFITNLYLKANKDVEQAGINPLVHYLKFGKKEGRRISIPELYQQFLGVQVEVHREQNFTDLFALVHPEPQQFPLRTGDVIDILIPILDGLCHPCTLLNSITKNTSGPYRLLIGIDNSTDAAMNNYLAEFEEQYPELEITIVANTRRMGYGKTVNRLAKLTENHFVIINTGMEVPPNWVERLMYPILTDNSVASTTPFTNVGSICSFPNFLEDNPLFGNMDVATIDSNFQKVDYDKNVTQLPTAAGFCMGVNRNVYKKIGLFRQVFGLVYGETTDWCMRAAKAGYRHVIVPNLFVNYKQGGSFSIQEKDQIQHENSKLVNLLQPDYYQQIDEFIRNDPLAHLRNALLTMLLSSTGHSKLVFDHAVGGGANEYTRLSLVGTGLTLIISPDNQMQNFRIMLVVEGRKTEAYRLQDYDDICEVIDTLKLNDVVVNELVSFPEVLKLTEFPVNLKKIMQDLRFTFVIHDYYSICPSFNLLDHTGKFCGIPEDLAYCKNCLRLNPLAEDGYLLLKRDRPDAPMAEWREKFFELLNICSKITCFSNSSRELLLKAYPELGTTIEVTPHEVGWIRKANILKTSDRLNIAVIGYLTMIKGAGRIVELAHYFEEKQINANIHIFGPVIEPYNAEFDSIPNVSKHYSYIKSDLPDLMEKFEIDMVFIASICPETFSYTTQEAIEMDIPVAVFDLGAPAERVKAYRYGLILENDSPEYIYHTMRKYLDSLEK